MLGTIFDGGDNKSYTTVQSKYHDIGKEEKLRIASKCKEALLIAATIIHLILLALYTNLGES